MQFVAGRLAAPQPGQLPGAARRVRAPARATSSPTSVAIASSKATTDRLKYLRTYAQGKVFAPVTGFYSLVYGPAGMERAENGVLAGTDDRLALRRLSDLFTGRDPKGGNVDLTIYPQGAGDGLRAQWPSSPARWWRSTRSTGAILAMVSTPSYDPNVLSSHDPDKIRAAYNRLINAPGDPLLDKAIAQTYPPGSTFKTVVAAAGLNAGRTPQTQLDAPTALTLPQTSHHAAQLRRRAVWRRPDRQHDRRADDLLQHGVRQTRHGPR